MESTIVPNVSGECFLIGEMNAGGSEVRDTWGEGIAEGRVCVEMESSNTVVVLLRERAEDLT